MTESFTLYGQWKVTDQSTPTSEPSGVQTEISDRDSSEQAGMPTAGVPASAGLLGVATVIAAAVGGVAMLKRRGC